MTKKRWLQPKIRQGKNLPSTETHIGQAYMTDWEHEWQKLSPYNSYAIGGGWNDDDCWDELARDFVAYWKCQIHKLIQEYGRHDIKPVQEIDVWLDPILKLEMNPFEAENRHWEEYDKATHLSVGRTSVQKCADGTIINEKKEVIGRWDDNEDGIRQWAISKGEDPDEAVKIWQEKTNYSMIEPSVEQESQSLSTPEDTFQKVLEWAGETHFGKEHCDRWKRAANGIQPGFFHGFDAMSSLEAKTYTQKFMFERWNPVYLLILQKEQERDQQQEIPEEKRDGLAKTLAEKIEDSVLPESETPDQARPQNLQAMKPLQPKQNLNEVRLPDDLPPEFGRALQNEEWLQVANLARRQHDKKMAEKQADS